MSAALAIATWGAAVGGGLMAGVYFAFSAFVMKSLGSLPRARGISAMQAINEVILSSAFLPLFFVTTALYLGLAGYAGLRWGAPGSWALLLGGALYVIGMFAMTVLGNVPLNEALKAIDPAGEQAETLWAHYLDRWVLYNHVRTLASTAASGLLIVALLQGR